MDTGQEIKEMVLRGIISQGLSEQQVEFLLKLEKHVTDLRERVSKLEARAALEGEK